MKTPNLILVIPGNWERKEDVMALLEKNTFFLDGQTLYSFGKKENFHFDFIPHEKGIEKSFFYASGKTFDSKTIKKISNHNSIVVLEADNSDIASIKTLILLSNLIIETGGYAIKVETTGVAYTTEEWSRLENEENIQVIYNYLVSIVRDDSERKYYSFGMKSFGLEDVMISHEIEEVAINAIQQFNLYRLFENPVITNGDTVTLGQKNRLYIIRFQQDFRYEENDLFYNQLGILELKEK